MYVCVCIYIYMCLCLCVFVSLRVFALCMFGVLGFVGLRHDILEWVKPNRKPTRLQSPNLDSIKPQNPSKV